MVDTRQRAAPVGQAGPGEVAGFMTRERFIWGLRYGEVTAVGIGVLYPLMRLLGFFSIRTGLAFLVLGAVLLPANLVGRRLYRRSTHVGGIVLLGIVLNVFLLIVAIHWTSGVQSPFLPLFAILAVGSSVHVDFKTSVLMSVLAGLLLLAMGLLEYEGALPHVPLFSHREDPGLYLQLPYVVFIPVSLLAFMLLVSYGSGSLAGKIREREIELRMQEKERWAALGHFSAVVAHEIKNPLGAIRGAAGLLGRDDLSAPDRTRMSDTIRGEVDRLDRLVVDYLRFARPREPNLREVDLGEIVRRVENQVRMEFAPSGVKLDCETGGRPHRVRADADQLFEALLNLVQNARQAVAVGGRVWIKVMPVGPSAVALEVNDNGPGVSIELRRKILEPFFTTKAKGSGLGLSVVKQIVDVHGGTLDVGEREGGGAAFKIVLPEEA
ncbi:MAG: hypothetical protein HYT87_12320 [Nitrospirae bacterium]|nr:hypothetical protein [Nitrospirota bacterium]